MNPSSAAFSSELKNHLKKGLDEDAWGMDWTAISAASRRPRAQAEVVAKSAGIWVGPALAQAAESLARDLGLSLKIKNVKSAGASLKSGEVVCRWEGDSQAILAFERPFLNLASYVGGIAYQTAQLVSLVKRASRKEIAPRVTLTRKTLPHYRDLAIHSVILGGGHPHRVSLSGGVLIKENHIALAGSVTQAIRSAQALAPHSVRIEIEVTNASEFQEALKSQADVVMLDNFSPTEVRSALSRVPTTKKPIIEVSGGINVDTIAEYAIPGVDVISVGSLTHSVRGIDLSLLVRKKKR